MRVVVVEPAQLAGRVLEFVLADAGHEVAVVASAAAALGAVVGRETDAVLAATDLAQPGPDGYALGKELRARRYAGPLLFLGPSDLVDEKLRAFAVGADDYLVAPCDPRELLARLEAAARRFRAADRQALGTILRAGDAELSIGELTFRRDGCAPAELTPTELRLLELLMRNQGITLSRDTIIERTWGYDMVGDSNRVDVYIRRLRKKVEDDPERPEYIHTARGLGYAFRPPAVAALAPIRPAPPAWADRLAGD